MADPNPYPALPWSVDARILQALKAKLADDPINQEIFLTPPAGGIWIVELRSLLSEESITPPLLGLGLLADEETNFTSSYGATLEVVVELYLLTPQPAGFAATDDLLRSRIVAHQRRLIRANAGVLTEGDIRLTEGVTRITKVNYDRAQLPSRVLLTVVQVVYRSHVDLVTQEVL